MEQNIKPAVIGATGKSGKYLVTELINQGFPLKVLLRNPESFQIKNTAVEVIKGDARDYKAIRSLTEDCTAVISTLGQPKGEPPIFSHATKNVIRAINECKAERYILTTGLNVDTPFDKKGLKTFHATEWMKTNFPETSFDKQAEYNILSHSGIDWTLVRLPLIKQTNERGQVLVSLEDCPGDEISATDLAHFLIGQLADNSYRQKAPFIATG